MLKFVKCWTGRRWIDIGNGWFAIGFGPNKFIERIYWKGGLIYPKSKEDTT